MIEYRVTLDPKNNRFIIQSDDIIKGSIAVNIPDSNKKKKQYISLFLHKADIEEGIDFLHCISADKPVQMNQALFITALSSMIKCFQTATACSMINPDTFFKKFPQEKPKFERFKDWRNKHFLHDENSMREAVAFLLVAPEGTEAVFGGPPSVIWNRVPIDFLLEGRQLETLMKTLHQFICEQIDALGQSLIDEYKENTREELLALGEAQLKLSTTENPNIPRG